MIPWRFHQKLRQQCQITHIELYQIKIYLHSKEKINTMKRPPVEWEKYLQTIRYWVNILMSDKIHNLIKISFGIWDYSSKKRKEKKERNRNGQWPKAGETKNHSTISYHIKTQMGYHVNYSYIKHDKDVVRKDLLHNMNWNVNECSYYGKCHKYPQKVKYKSRPNNLPPECYRPKKWD